MHVVVVLPHEHQRQVRALRLEDAAQRRGAGVDALVPMYRVLGKKEKRGDVGGRGGRASSGVRERERDAYMCVEGGTGSE